MAIMVKYRQSNPLARFGTPAPPSGDFHPATLSWLRAVVSNPIVPLGVDRFGQSGNISDLYRAYGIDTDAILAAAAARACLTALWRTQPTLG